MTREEKAHSLGQMYFPDDQNIWARPNYEAKFVSDACMQMAEWERKMLIEKAVNWLVTNASDYAISTTGDDDDCVVSLDMVENFKEAMEV